MTVGYGNMEATKVTVSEFGLYHFGCKIISYGTDIADADGPFHQNRSHR